MMATVDSTHAIRETRFFSGGNATFTVDNGQGTHYTFKISKGQDDDAPYFVGLLSGPDNESSYRYLGIYKPDTGRVILTRKSGYKAESTPVKVIRWALAMLHAGKEFPAGYALMHAGRCCVCGRKLTTPESIEAGIGPICAAKGDW